MNKNDKNGKNTCDDASAKEKEHTPVENQRTAAWAGIEKQKSEGKVPIPSIDNVKDAKEWVDENKK